MRCFTDEELRHGLQAVIADWNSCAVCGGDNDDTHDALPHPFEAPDVLDLFLQGTRVHDRETPDGESDLA